MERHLIVDHLKLTYEGLCNAPEVFNLISQWFYDKGWDWHEKTNQEVISADGKQLHLILEPSKSVSDYYKLIMKLTINFINLKEVEVEHDGKTIKLQQGVMRMMIDGYIISDRNAEWDEKPFYWFLSFIVERYFFRNHFKKFENWLRGDVEDLHDKIKNYLNTYKYTYQH